MALCVMFKVHVLLKPIDRDLKISMRAGDCPTCPSFYLIMVIIICTEINVIVQSLFMMKKGLAAKLIKDPLFSLTST
jgi:hypothetical protein